MSSTTASRIFAAQDENVPAITAFITEQAELAGVSPKRILQLELVIEEVVVISAIMRMRCRRARLLFVLIVKRTNSALSLKTAAFLLIPWRRRNRI